MTEELKSQLDYFKDEPKYLRKVIAELEQENRWQRDEEKYLKECCIKAGKELEKHSFKWDGKEKNLVVQALQLNQLYEKLEQENKELKEMLSKEPKAMQAFQISYSGLKRDNETLWGMVKDYKTALEEIKSIIINDNSILVDKKDYIELQCGEPIALKLQKIYNKINKVLNKG